MKKQITAAFMTAVMAFSSISAEASAVDTWQKLVTADLTKSNVSVRAELRMGTYGKWSSVSPISDFIDNEGRYTIAYSDGTTIYVAHCAEKKDGMRIADTVKFAKPMEKLGGVICDRYGNLYVACGQDDNDNTGTICTFAIYKYSSEGKYLGKAEYYPDDKYWSTKIPFDAGNCVMTFQRDLLVCSYAREMYSGHQSNAVFCVDTVTMTENPVYDSYCSHSFNQSIITLDNETVVFADHGDAYPRGFAVNVVSTSSAPMYGHNNKGIVPFHFSLSGNTGDMFNVNYTNSKLTGIVELDTGVALVGSSGDYEKETPQQMFMQIIDPDSGKQVLSGATRTGTSAYPYGGAYTDTGILWLTDYKDGSEVGASATVALDDSRLLVMWERWNGYNFINSYFSIVSSDGRILMDSMPMRKARLNGNEELDVIGNVAYWTYSDGDGKDVDIYRCNTSSYTTDTIGDAEITLSTDSVLYNGKYQKPTVTVKYEGVTLKKGKDYTVSYKKNKSPGLASVIIKGKGIYDGKQTVNFEITPEAAKGIKAKQTTSSKNTITWNPVANADGYEVLISRYTKDGYWYWRDKQVTRSTREAKYVHVAGKNKDYIFHYIVRPYVKVNGKKVYGEWSDEVNPYW